MPDKSVFVYLGTLATGQSINMIYDRDFGPCNAQFASRRNED